MYSVFFMLRDEISRLRQNYCQSSLNEDEAHSNAIQQFDAWFKDATTAEIFEPNAMTLATSKNNTPDARIVLLKSFDANGFVFFTNFNSAKGKDLEENPRAALVFLWKELERQVRIRGGVEKVDPKIAAAYFATRPLESQQGAIASTQSAQIASRTALENKYKEVKEKYGSSKADMPRHWGGFRLVPKEIEFWQGREGRMHDRLLYTKKKDSWDIVRLQP